MTTIDIDHSDEKNRNAYHHGDETFGDVLSHPLEELHAHRKRKEEFEERMQKSRSGILEQVEPEQLEDFVVVVHFRQLRGNQGFAIDHDKAAQFAKKASRIFGLKKKGVHIFF
ncbi:unnamed protein product [Absidia cylindrospora]